MQTASEPKPKVKVTSITLNRGEGPSSECNKPVTVPNFAAANAILRRWSWTASKSGGSDKVDFSVTYKDGEVYEGCFLLKHPNAPHQTGSTTLDGHIRTFLRVHSGLLCPPHLERERYEEWMEQYRRHDPSFLECCKQWLENYELSSK